MLHVMGHFCMSPLVFLFCFYEVDEIRYFLPIYYNIQTPNVRQSHLVSVSPDACLVRSCQDKMLAVYTIRKPAYVQIASGHLTFGSL